MNVSLEPEAKQDLAELEEKLSEEIILQLEGLRQDPLPDNSYVIQLPDGTEIQCLKLQEEDRNSELNHSITYDTENKEVRIYGVFNRRPGYQNIKQRTQDRK
jgi:hypothetical protein